MKIENQILACLGCILMVCIFYTSLGLHDTDTPEADHFSLFWMSLLGLAMFAILAAGGVTP